MERVGYLGLKRVLGLDKFLDEKFGGKLSATDDKSLNSNEDNVDSSSSTTCQSSSAQQQQTFTRMNDKQKKGTQHYQAKEPWNETTSSSSLHHHHHSHTLPPFVGIPYDSIVLVDNEEKLIHARNDLLNQHIIGFDTESKPDLYSTTKRSGPHLLQLSTTEKTYLFSFVIQRWSPDIHDIPSGVHHDTNSSSSELEKEMMTQEEIKNRIPSNNNDTGHSEKSTNYAMKLSALFNLDNLQANNTAEMNKSVNQVYKRDNSSGISHHTSDGLGSKTNSTTTTTTTTTSTASSSSTGGYIAISQTTWKQKIKLRKQIQQFLKEILESTSIIKVGFGLKDDSLLLWKNYQIQLMNEIDLSQQLRPRPSANLIGVKKAVQIWLQQELIKSKRITISNWGIPMEYLKRNQILYAANDAYAALLVYQAWLRQSNSPTMSTTKSMITTASSSSSSAAAAAEMTKTTAVTTNN
jgi:hypothetical protein